MKKRTQKRCLQMIENRMKMKSVFSLDGSLMNIICSCIYMLHDKVADEGILSASKIQLKTSVALFSNFRNTARSPVVCMMSNTEKPGETLKNVLYVYDLLKKEFLLGSEFLPLTATAIVLLAKPDDYEFIVKRTKILYNLIKNDHPFMTSGEDIAICALMAFDSKTDNKLLMDSRESYYLLKQYFRSPNDAYSLSHIFTMFSGSSQEKSKKTYDLYCKLKKMGCRYGTRYELPILGLVAMSSGTVDEIAADIVDTERYLSIQRGFGFVNNIEKKHRLLFSSILVQDCNLSPEILAIIFINSIMSRLTSQQAAMRVAMSSTPIPEKRIIKVKPMSKGAKNEKYNS